MSRNRVAVLSPPGSAAIAVLAIRGPEAFQAVRRYFRPAGAPLPMVASKPGFRFGRFGGEHADEVVLVVHECDNVEIHCHGGPRVVESLVGLLQSSGIEPVEWSEMPDPRYANELAAALLPFARTVRTASILLDQALGAYDRAIAAAWNGRRNSAPECPRWPTSR